MTVLWKAPHYCCFWSPRYHDGDFYAQQSSSVIHYCRSRLTSVVRFLGLLVDKIVELQYDRRNAKGWRECHVLKSSFLISQPSPKYGSRQTLSNISNQNNQDSIGIHNCAWRSFSVKIEHLRSMIFLLFQQGRRAAHDAQRTVMMLLFVTTGPLWLDVLPLNACQYIVT